MLNRSQLLLLAAMVTLGGCFGGGLAVGVIAGDLDFALISLGLIVALFVSVFVFSGENPKKQKRAGDIHVGGELNPEFKDTDEGIENLKSAAHECGKAIGDFADSIARDFGLSQKKPQICSICLKDAHNSVMDIETYYEGGIIFKRAINYPNHKAIWFCDDHKRESFIYNRIG